MMRSQSTKGGHPVLSLSGREPARNQRGQRMDRGSVNGAGGDGRRGGAGPGDRDGTLRGPRGGPGGRDGAGSAAGAAGRPPLRRWKRREPSGSSHESSTGGPDDGETRGARWESPWDAATLGISRQASLTAPSLPSQSLLWPPRPPRTILT